MAEPPKKKFKLTELTIEKLPDALLARVFSYLPLEERFQLPAVCNQWRNVSRIPWTDVSYLDVTSIPESKISAVLSLCAKVKEFAACKRTIDLEDSQNLLGPHLRALRFYHVELSFSRTGNRDRDKQKFARLLAAFFESLTGLEELVWQNVYAYDYDGRIPGRTRGVNTNNFPRSEIPIPISNAMVASLRQLKISNAVKAELSSADILSPLARLAYLTCLHFEGVVQPSSVATTAEAAERFWVGLAALKSLRELCLAMNRLLNPDGDSISLKQLARVACESLPQLEVLIFASESSFGPEGISQLVTSHPSLRILVIAGVDYDLVSPAAAPFVVPPRRIHSPILQVFVGGNIVRKLRFTRPEANTTKFWLIDCELPQFLAKPEVAEVFEGVQLARMFQESVAIGQEYWIWGMWWGAPHLFTPAPRVGLRSSTAALADNYWPEAVLRQGP